MSDPSEEDPLPEIGEGLLIPSELAQLFRDYDRCTGSVEIVVKGGRGYVTNQSQPKLQEAEQLLLQRGVRGIQVRYEYEGARWCDTLMPTDGGVRLVRIRQ